MATLLRALLLTGLLCSVHSNCCTTVACAHLPQPQPQLVHVRTRFPCRISSFWREQPHAALPSHSQLPTAVRVRQACLRESVQAVHVVVDALAGIRSAVSLRRRITDRRRRQSQRAKHGRNDAAAALDQLCATDWSDLLADAVMSTSTAPTHMLCSSWRTRSAPPDTRQCSRALKILESTTT